MNVDSHPNRTDDDPETRRPETSRNLAPILEICGKTRRCKMVIIYPLYQIYQ